MAVMTNVVNINNKQNKTTNKKKRGSKILRPLKIFNSIFRRVKILSNAQLLIQDY